MMPPHLMRLTGTLRNSQSIVLSFWLAVLCCSQGIAGQGRAGLRAEVRRKSLRNFVARASGDQDPLGQEQASQAQAPQSSPSPQVQAGQTLFTAQCAFCHGRDAAGGETGPDLTSSETVEKDVGGNEIGSVVRTGRPDRGMPQFNLTDTDLAAIVAFLHDEKAKAESKPGRRRNVQPEDLQTGNAEAGQDYFNGAGGCSRCHSPTGDLAGVATRPRGLALLQRMLYPKPRASGEDSYGLSVCFSEMASGGSSHNRPTSAEDHEEALLLGCPPIGRSDREWRAVRERKRGLISSA